MVCFYSCDSEDAWDCIQSAGSEVQIDYEIDSFTSLLVNRNIEVVIEQAEEYRLRIVTGENLLSDIEFKVDNNQLVLTDNNNCNYVRDYGITKMYVFAPNISVIRSSTQYEISSNGPLNYQQLLLISEDFNDDSFFNVGDFRLDVNSESLSISSNNSSFFYLTGTTENLSIGFFSGVGRFEGENLIATNVEVFHRGSNDMLINPQETLKGELRGAGNLLSFNSPDLIDVQRFYKGQLIFVD